MSSSLSFIESRKLSVAPMLDWTDRDFRYLLRLISKHTLLYTEMVTTGALIHGDRQRFLAHDEDENIEQIVSSIEYIGPDYEEKGMSVRISLPNRTIQTGIKSDFKSDLTKDHRRPKYSWETGRIKYGDMETNADFFFTDQKNGELSFTVVNLTRAIFKGKLLYQQPSSYFGLNFDGTPDRPDVGKARLWRDVVKLEK